jgi:hypothetical protein
LTFVAAFLWGFVLIAGFAGYGEAVRRLLGWKPRDGGLAVALGVSLLIVFGGPLSLARVLSAALFVALIAVGVATWVALGGVPRLLRTVGRLRSWDRAMVCVLLLAYLNWLCFNQSPDNLSASRPHALLCSDGIYDDGAYALFPVRMIQTGSLGVDPFSDRLTGSALGGESFAQAFALVLFPIEYIHLVDPGLAYLMMGVILISTRRLTPPVRCLLGCAFAAYPTASINASAVALPVVLLTALARAVSQPRAAGPLQHSVVVALLLAALLTLKMTLVPGGVVLVFFWGVILAKLTWSFRPIVRGAFAGLTTLSLLLPWMIHSYRSAGTLLYPLLGPGFRRHTLASYPHPVGFWSLATVSRFLVEIVPKPQMLVLLIGVSAALLCVVVRPTPSGRRASLFAAVSTSALCIGLLAATFTTIDSWRYTYPYSAFMCVFAYATLFQVIPAAGRWRYARAAACLPLLLMTVYYGWKALVGSHDLPASVSFALKGGSRFPTEQIQAYHRLQASIPPGSRILCLLDWPALLDLSRNDVFYPDNIGGISPPPGIPLQGQPEELADYLRSLGIRYVACPAPRLMTFRMEGYSAPAAREKWKEHPWEISALTNLARAYKLLSAIASRYRLLYRDDEAIVIDLLSPAEDSMAG